MKVARMMLTLFLLGIFFALLAPTALFALVMGLLLDEGAVYRMVGRVEDGLTWLYRFGGGK